MRSTQWKILEARRSDFWAHATLWAAGGVFLAATEMLLSGNPFMKTWYYCFAWWPYILGMEAWLHIRERRSVLFAHPGRFWTLLPLSVSCWLVFEVANFRLANWHYLNLPSDRLIRWWGYWIAYATVLPGIFTTARFWARCLPERRSERMAQAARPLSSSTSRKIQWIGAGCLVAPMVVPKIAFPLIWLAFFFLLDPWNARMGARSLISEWLRRDFRRTYCLLASGALCGFLWELWNYGAGSKWVYTVPFVGEVKLFEMPVLGFFGFPPFALECFAMTETFCIIKRKLKEQFPSQFHTLLNLDLFLLSVVFDLVVFVGIDRWTVRSWIP